MNEKVICIECDKEFELYDRQCDLCKKCAFLEQFAGNDAFMEILEQLYTEANKQAKKDPDFYEKAKNEFVKLEQGDPENTKIWAIFVYHSLSNLKKNMKSLGLLPFESCRGESGYQYKEFMDHPRNSLKVFLKCLQNGRSSNS